MAVCKRLIDLETDDLRPINELCKRRLGRKVSPATLWRWRLKGARGVKLECVYVTGVWCTTTTAFAAFIAGTTAAASPIDDEPRERPESTEAKLKAAGLL